MAGVAESAVLVPSASASEALTKLKRVQGPSSDFHNPQHVLKFYPSMGFQATNFGRACHIAGMMLRRQAPSKVYRMKDGKYFLVRHDDAENDNSEVERETEGRKKETRSCHGHVWPLLFLGITANLLGTGCREAVRFLVQEGVIPNPAAASPDGFLPPPPADDASEDQIMFARLKKEYIEVFGTRPLPDEEVVPAFRSFLCSVVVSGGGVEHDVRRACATYTVTHYASEEAAVMHATAEPQRRKKTPSRFGPASNSTAHFGNVSYPPKDTEASTLFDMVMHTFAQRLRARQERLHAVAAGQPIPEKYLDMCSWSVTPSEVWALLGLWLVDILTEALHTLQHHTKASEGGEQRIDTNMEPEVHPYTELHPCATCRAAALAMARTTVVYWAAVQQVPLYSPSFVDGDIAAYLLPSTAEEEVTLQVDLVRDIHSINKLAMQGKKTGMLICGGGVVKHHVCNANLMRNGADYTIILNNGQEFDGSDAGAKPEEALSWGKVRMEGEFVKVYGEVTTYLPLLVAQVFVPAVRRRNRQHTAAVASTRRNQQGGEDVEHPGMDSNTAKKRKRKRSRRALRRQQCGQEVDAVSSNSPPDEAIVEERTEKRKES